MLGILSEKETEDILKEQVIGRIGCHANDITYVVPVTYVYDGVNIYAHSSATGMKMDMMRKNPEICFEVDAVRDMANWKSVIAWGVFEPITNDEEKVAAMKKLVDKLSPLITSETAQPSHGLMKHAGDVKGIPVQMYKIKLKNKTGRFERR
jgi:hypothetical protein